MCIMNIMCKSKPKYIETVIGMNEKGEIGRSFRKNGMSGHKIMAVIW